MTCSLRTATDRYKENYSIDEVVYPVSAKQVMNEVVYPVSAKQVMYEVVYQAGDE